MSTTASAGGYTVWRRSDGYTAASAGIIPAERLDKGGMTFETVLHSGDWLAARARINAEREADRMNADVLPLPWLASEALNPGAGCR